MPRLSGSEIVVEYLIREGVPYISGLPGHGTLAFMDALPLTSTNKIQRGVLKDLARGLVDGAATIDTRAM